MKLSEVKSVIKKALPHPVLNLIRIHRNLSTNERRTYWKLRIERVINKTDFSMHWDSSSINSVLFVCRGNIIRSPMAEFLLKHLLHNMGISNIHVSSAGIYAKDGRQADYRALNAARKYGISLARHKAQPVTKELVDKADLIYVMDMMLEAEMLERYPYARSKLQLPVLNLLNPNADGYKNCGVEKCGSENCGFRNECSRNQSVKNNVVENHDLKNYGLINSGFINNGSNINKIENFEIKGGKPAKLIEIHDPYDGNNQSVIHCYETLYESIYNLAYFLAARSPCKGENL